MYKIYALKIKNTDIIGYVGRTSKSLEERFKSHLRSIKYDKRKTHRHYWIKKHYDELEIILIEENIETFEESCTKEIYYIAKYRELYELVNLTDGGEGGCPGYKHTEEAKMKIGNVHRGKIMSEEHKNILRNRIVTEETRKKLSDIMKVIMVGEGNPMYGRKRPDTVELNKKRTGWKHSEETINKMKIDRIGENSHNYRHGRSTKAYKEAHKRIYKLTKEDVIKMREMWETGDYKIFKEIGDIFGISERYASAVIRKVRWKNI